MKKKKKEEKLRFRWVGVGGDGGGSPPPSRSSGTRPAAERNFHAPMGSTKREEREREREKYHRYLDLPPPTLGPSHSFASRCPARTYSRWPALVDFFVKRKNTFYIDTFFPVLSIDFSFFGTWSVLTLVTCASFRVLHFGFSALLPYR